HYCLTIVEVVMCLMSALFIFIHELMTYPFAGSKVNPSAQLIALDPQIDPYSTQFLGTSVCLSYQTTTTSASRLLLVTCGTSSLAGPPAGDVITGSASVVDVDGTLGATATGSLVVIVGTVSGHWNPGGVRRSG